MISVILSFSDSTTGENTTTGYINRLFVTFCDMSQKAIDITGYGLMVPAHVVCYIRCREVQGVQAHLRIVAQPCTIEPNYFICPVHNNRALQPVKVLYIQPPQ